MAKIFLSEDEAVAWGLASPPKKRIFNHRKMINNVTIRVIAGVIVLVLALALSVSTSGKLASLVSGT